MGKVVSDGSKKGGLGFLVCAAAAVFYCYEYLLRITPSIMVDELAATFQANATQIGLLSASFYFVYTPMQLVVGLLSDYFGSRRVLLAAIVSCVMGSILFSNAANLATAYLGRGMIGFGSAFAFVGSIKLASAWLSRSYISLFVGLTTALGMLGAILQTNVLPRVMHTIGWHQVIHIGTWVGLLLLLLCYFVLYDSPASWVAAHGATNGQQLDKNGEIITDGPERLSFGAVWNNLLRVITTTKIWISGTIAGVLYLSLSMVAELWGIPLLTELYHLSAAEAATSCSMIYLGWLVGGPLVGYLGARFNVRKILVTGLLSSGTIITTIIYWPNLFNLLSCRIALCLFGVTSSVEVLCFDLSNRYAPTEAVATATSFTNCLVMLGGFVTQPLIGAVLDFNAGNAEMVGGELMTSYSAANYQWAFMFLPLMLVAGLILTRYLRSE